MAELEIEEDTGLDEEALKYMGTLVASIHTQADIDIMEQAGVSEACFADAKNYWKALRYVKSCIRRGKTINYDHIRTKYKIDPLPDSSDDPLLYANEVVFYAANAQADEILAIAQDAIKGAQRKEFYDAIDKARNNLRGLAGPQTGAQAGINGGQPVRYDKAGSMKNPAPQKWLVRGVVPDNWPTFFYGAGGSAKSYLAVLLALSVATGTQFLGTDVPHGHKVLYLDWEMDEETFRARVNRVARGMKLSLKDGCPNLIYRRLRKPLVDYMDDIAEQVETEGIGLVIIDSFGFSMTGMDTNLQPDVTAQMARIAEIPAACVIIDHISKHGKGEDGPFGSIYKHAAARWMWWCRASSKEECPDGKIKPGIFVRMWNAKHNIAAQQNDIYLHIEWDDDFDAKTVRMKKVNREDVPESLTQDITETEEKKKGGLGTTSSNVLRAILDVPKERTPNAAWLLEITDYSRVTVDKVLAKLEQVGEIRSEKVQPIDVNGKKQAWCYAYYPVGKTVPSDRDIPVAEDLKKV